MTKLNLKFLATLCPYCEVATRLVITHQRAYLIEYNLRSHFFPLEKERNCKVSYSHIALLHFGTHYSRQF